MAPHTTVHTFLFHVFRIAQLLQIITYLGWRAGVGRSGTAMEDMNNRRGVSVDSLGSALPWKGLTSRRGPCRF